MARARPFLCETDLCRALRDCVLARAAAHGGCGLVTASAAWGTVWHLYSQSAAEQIRAFAPDARIIIMLRPPVEMMHSLYGLFLFTTWESLPTSALRAGPRMIGGADAASRRTRGGRRRCNTGGWEITLPSCSVTWICSVASA